MVKLAERDRRLRQAQESGRRQAEERLREREDIMFRQGGTKTLFIVEVYSAPRHGWLLPGGGLLLHGSVQPLFVDHVCVHQGTVDSYLDEVLSFTVVFSLLSSDHGCAPRHG